MKVLSIGNSFSQDAHRWLHRLALANGIALDTVNLCIGGCSLERHWQCLQNNTADYMLEINGEEAQRYISLPDALQQDRYDVVTLQQVSQLTGRYDTYLPYLTELAAVVREKQPQAALYFQQTWAYEVDSQHSGFALYYNDQQEMFRCIKETTETAARQIGATLIPTGTVIQKLRKTAPFDYAAGGLSLCRDGFHLTLDYGRYAAAATWLKTLTGCSPKDQPFEDFDTALIQQIHRIVTETV